MAFFLIVTVKYWWIKVCLFLSVSFILTRQSANMVVFFIIIIVILDQLCESTIKLQKITFILLRVRLIRCTHSNYKNLNSVLHLSKHDPIIFITVSYSIILEWELLQIICINGLKSENYKILLVNSTLNK
jgi:hypothetical protein